MPAPTSSRPPVAVALTVLAALALPGVTATPREAALRAGEPTAFDQYMLEVTNRARAAPGAEAAAFGIDLNEGPPSIPLTDEPRQPLAFNLLIIGAARAHNADLFANFDGLPSDHRGSDGRTPTQRVRDAGVDLPAGENNAWKSQSSTKLKASSVDALHALLFKDFIPGRSEVKGRGHRVNLLNAKWNEVGMAVDGGVFGGRKVALTTHDFVSSGRVLITGVAYIDSVAADDFYTPGEGLADITITARSESDGKVHETTTWESGGYSLEVDPGDTYTVTASGGRLVEPIVAGGVAVGDRNVKVDFVPDALAPPPPPAPPPARFELVKGLAKKSRKTNAWSFKLARAIYRPGFSQYDGDLAELRILINGAEFFGSSARVGAKIKMKASKKTGRIEKIAVKTADRSKLAIDLRKGTIKISIKRMPESFSPEGGVRIEVFLGTTRAVLRASAAVAGTKAILSHDASAVGPIPDDGAPL